MSKQANEIKKQVYVFSFALLGMLTGTVIYGAVSIWLILHGYEINFNWYLAILMVGGTIAGFMEGLRWWRIIYVEKAYLKWSRHTMEMKLIGLLFLIILTVAAGFIASNYKL